MRHHKPCIVQISSRWQYSDFKMLGLITRLKLTPFVIFIIKNKKQVDMIISLLVILTLLYSVLITGCNEAVVDSDPSADGIVRALDDTEKALSEAGNEFSYQI